ncbi:hypothetical protein L226DRAFT_569487 [Lentinus tigrinus ALCF2SS1-7]|uniref:uncharacterized protein n=1 Tax=Lentinus tigrinus ALCF2SS1-7 TaxID=1328758 RepID=UPI001165FFFD|nr:hypothetical protein L226DRAFT_569487 [Lentinus tigrinus ALCF2SS1-7]
MTFSKHTLTLTSLDGVGFGHGRKCWFFAAAELKAFLAYIVVHYDIKLEGKTRPKNLFFSMGTVRLRTGKRQVEVL